MFRLSKGGGFLAGLEDLQDESLGRGGLEASCAACYLCSDSSCRGGFLSGLGDSQDESRSLLGFHL